MQPEEFEQLSAGLTPEEFEHLCQCLVAADFPYGLPVFSGRANTADGGYDSLVRLDSSQAPSRLVSPGLNLYEVKWRSPFQRETSFDYLCKKGEKAPLHRKLKKLRHKMNEPLVLRVFINLNLNTTQREKLLQIVSEDCDCPDSKVEIVDAGAIALELNLHAHLRAAFRPGESVQTHQGWKRDILERTRNQGGPLNGRFFGRKKDIEELRKALLESSWRLFRVSGPAEVGKTRFVAEAIPEELSLKTVVALDKSVFDGSAWTQLKSQEMLLILDEPSEAFERRAVEQVLSTPGVRLLVISPRNTPPHMGVFELDLGGLDQEAAWSLCNNLPRKQTQWDTGWLIEQLHGYPGLLMAAARTTMMPQGDLAGYIRELAKYRAEQIADPETYKVAQLHALSIKGLLLDHRIPEEWGIPTPTHGEQQRALNSLKAQGFVDKQGLRYRIVPSALADYLVGEYWREKAPPQAFDFLIHNRSEFAADARDALLKTVSPTSKRLAGRLLDELDFVDLLHQSPRLLRALLEHQPGKVAETLRHLPPETSARLPLVFVRQFISIPETAEAGLKILRRFTLSSEFTDGIQEGTYYTLFLPHWPDVALSLSERQTELKELRAEVGIDGIHYWGALNGMLGDRRMMSVGFETIARPSVTRHFSKEQIESYLRANINTALQDAETSSVEPELLIRFAENLFEGEFREEALRLFKLLAIRQAYGGTRLLSALSQRMKQHESWAERLRALRQDVFAADPLQELLWWTTTVWPRIENDRDDRKVDLLRRERFQEIALALIAGGTLPSFENRGRHLHEFFKTLGSLDKGLILAGSISEEITADYWEGVSEQKDGEQKVLNKILDGETTPNQRYRIASQLNATLVPPDRMVEWATDASLNEEDFERVILSHWTRNLSLPALVEFLTKLGNSSRNRSARFADELNDALQREDLTPEQSEAILDLARPLLVERFKGQKEDDFGELSFHCLFDTALEHYPEFVSKLFVETALVTPEEDGALQRHRATRTLWFDELCKKHPQAMLKAIVEQFLEPKDEWLPLTFNLREHFRASELRAYWESSDQTKKTAAFLAMLTGGQDEEFWLLAQDLLVALNYDKEIQSLLFKAACDFGCSYWGPESEQLKRMKPRFANPPGEEHLNSRMLTLIHKMGEQLEQRITGKIVWEYDLTSEEFRQMLDSRDELERRWAYMRILDQVKPKEWSQWLDWSKLREELPRLPLEPKRKADIESLAEYLSG